MRRVELIIEVDDGIDLSIFSLPHYFLKGRVRVISTRRVPSEREAQSYARRVLEWLQTRRPTCAAVLFLVLALSLTPACALVRGTAKGPSTSITVPSIPAGEQWRQDIAIQCDRIHVAVQTAIRLKRELLVAKSITPQQSNQVSRILLVIAQTAQEINERAHALDPNDPTAKTALIDLLNQIPKAIVDLNAKGVVPLSSEIQNAVQAIQAAAGLLKPLLEGALK